MVLGKLLLLAAASLLGATATGSVTMGFSAWWQGMASLVTAGPDTSMVEEVLALRIHRATLAFVTGGALALAGVMMQCLLRNPLSDPYVLGVSGGAAVGALGAMVIGAAAWMIDAAALAGALTISAILFLLNRRSFRNGTEEGGGSTVLLLAGVVLGAGCGALVTLLLAAASDAQLRGMVFWLIGDLSAAQWHAALPLALVLALGLSIRLARSMNLLAQYADEALTLGVAVARLRKILFFCAALLTSIVVTTAGSIGFVGLVVPHACRLALGPDHRLLLPASVLAGGAFLTIADTLARTVMAPQQLPVGVLTALIGVPVFLVQLLRAKDL